MLRQPFLGDVSPDIAGYVCEVSVGCIPYRSCEASSIFGVVRELCAMSVSAQLRRLETLSTHHIQDMRIVGRHIIRLWRSNTVGCQKQSRASNSLSIIVVDLSSEGTHSTLAAYVKLAHGHVSFAPPPLVSTPCVGLSAVVIHSPL